MKLNIIQINFPMCLFIFLNVTTRKFKIMCVAHIWFLLDSADRVICSQAQMKVYK